MDITIDEKVMEYLKQQKIEAICVENRPTGCSCVGIHIHAEPEYILEVSKYEKDEAFTMYITEEGIKVFVEKELFPLQKIEILGTKNPFNKKVYLHCNIK